MLCVPASNEVPEVPVRAVPLPDRVPVTPVAARAKAKAKAGGAAPNTPLVTTANLSEQLTALAQAISERLDEMKTRQLQFESCMLGQRQWVLWASCRVWVCLPEKCPLNCRFKIKFQEDEPYALPEEVEVVPAPNASATGPDDVGFWPYPRCYGRHQPVRIKLFDHLPEGFGSTRTPIRRASHRRLKPAEKVQEQ